MQNSLMPLSVLGPKANDERQVIRQRFESGGAVREILLALCKLADHYSKQIFGEVLRVHGAPSENICMLALGGYGRRLLFPYSDLDILFIFGDEKAADEFRPLIADFSRTLWDLGFRANCAGRTLEECRRIEADNAEFHLALLDRRFVAGDAALFEKLNARVLLTAEKQARPLLLAQLNALTKERLARYGNTIFHLEPNVKEAPGGLRDYQVKTWLRHLSEKKSLLTGRGLEDDSTSPAIDFISSIRCFLHYANSRNDNTLTYEMQAAAAERGLGTTDKAPRGATEWMRIYFQHARTVNRQLLRGLEQRSPAPPQSLRQRIFNTARAATKADGNEGKPFAIRDGLFEILDQPALSDRAVIFSLFTEAARAGVPLSRRAERTIAYIMKHPELPARNAAMTWPALRSVFEADYPAIALRSMRRLGLLGEFLLEFAKIDSLVVRDFYHRYTVDEHTLRTVEHLQELADPPDARGTHFQPLWKTVEHRDLLILALLLHDVGKGANVENPVAGSLEALETAAARLHLSTEEKEEVHFLILHHLDMAATVQRRDIFDPATIAAFAATVASHERLQRLCLLTYADVHAVNPEALTPWKAEMLWQLFVATASYLNHALDRDRLHVSEENSLLELVKTEAAVGDPADMGRFLEGFPRRYAAAHSPSQIASHFAMYGKLAAEPIQIDLQAASHSFSLTLMTIDRPALFATIADVLTRWGMNVIKADAFANSELIALDTFHFTDPSQTFEGSPNELARLRRNVLDAVGGKKTAEAPAKSRQNVTQERPPRLTTELHINFDDNSSERSTLLEVTAPDRAGLLRDVGSALARLGCNIEVALIDTEGQKAIDVFYLTERGKKLEPQKQALIRQELQQIIG